MVNFTQMLLTIAAALAILAGWQALVALQSATPSSTAIYSDQASILATPDRNDSAAMWRVVDARDWHGHGRGWGREGGWGRWRGRDWDDGFGLWYSPDPWARSCYFDPYMGRYVCGYRDRGHWGLGFRF
jgi:hypothetical protein